MCSCRTVRTKGEAWLTYTEEPGEPRTPVRSGLEFKRRTFHVPNLMQMSITHCVSSLTLALRTLVRCSRTVSEKYRIPHSVFINVVCVYYAFSLNDHSFVCIKCMLILMMLCLCN